MKYKIEVYEGHYFAYYKSFLFWKSIEMIMHRWVPHKIDASYETLEHAKSVIKKHKNRKIKIVYEE